MLAFQSAAPGAALRGRPSSGRSRRATASRATSRCRCASGCTPARSSGRRTTSSARTSSSRRASPRRPRRRDPGLRGAARGGFSGNGDGLRFDEGRELELKGLAGKPPGLPRRVGRVGRGLARLRWTIRSHSPRSSTRGRRGCWRTRSSTTPVGSRRLGPSNPARRWKYIYRSAWLDPRRGALVRAVLVRHRGRRAGGGSDGLRAGDLAPPELRTLAQVVAGASSRARRCSRARSAPSSSSRRLTRSTTISWSRMFAVSPGEATRRARPPPDAGGGGRADAAEVPAYLLDCQPRQPAVLPLARL